MALEEVGNKLVAEGADAYIGAMNNARGAYDNFAKGISSGADAASKSATGMDQIVTGALRHIGAMAVEALAAAGAAVVKFGADSVNMAADFEANMLRLKSVAGGEIAEAGLSLDQFREKALQLGKDTKYSAAEAQEAMINLAKGGVPVKDVMNDATTAVLNLASAGETELAPAAEIVAKQLGVWGNTGVTATDVANKLAQAANASTVDVDDLALGLANVGSVAKVAGVSFDETVKTMALIAPGFSSAADAGTSYKTFLNNLVPTTKRAIEASYEVGLMSLDSGRAMQFLASQGYDVANMSSDAMSNALDKLSTKMGKTTAQQEKWRAQFDKSVFYDAAGNFIGMEKAAEELSIATKNLTVEQRAMVLETIFGTDAQRAAAIIAEQGAEGFKKTTEQMGRAGDAAAQAAEKNKGFKFAQEQLNGSIDTFKIIVGSMLLPVLTSLFDNYITPGVNWMIAFAESFGKAGAEGGAFGSSLLAMLPSFDQIKAGLALLVASVIAGVGMISAYWDANGASIIASATATWNFVYQNVSAVLGAVWQYVQSVLTTLLAFWNAHGADIMATAGKVWESIKSIVSTAVEIISTVVTAVFTAVAGFINTNQAEIQTALEVSWNVIKTVITVALELIKGILKAALAILKGDWQGAWDAIKQTFATIWETIKTNLGQYWETIKTTISNALDKVKSTVETALQKVADFFRDKFDDAVKFVRNKIDAARDAANDLGAAILGALEAKMSAAKQAILGPIESAIESVRGAINGLWDTFNRLKSAAGSFIFPGSNSPPPPNQQTKFVRAAPSPAAVAAGAASITNNRSVAYNLNVSTRESVGSMRSGFALLAAAGR